MEIKKKDSTSKRTNGFRKWLDQCVVINFWRGAKGLNNKELAGRTQLEDQQYKLNTSKEQACPKLRRQVKMTPEADCILPRE